MTGSSALSWCEDFLSKDCRARAFLTPSATSALEVVGLMTLSPGDEVIIPDFCFPSCANVVLGRGATPVFVDVKPDTLSLDPDKLEEALSPKTRAVVVIHYAGHVDKNALDEIYLFCKRNSLLLIEDAAQCVGNWELSGDFGCMSFHWTKNVHCGQGGALFCKEEYEKETSIVRQCGTTKSDKPEWKWEKVGTHALMAEPLAEILKPQLETLSDINGWRRETWRIYKKLLSKMGHHSVNEGNGHIFWLMTDLQKEAKEAFSNLSSHYEAAHLTPVGKLGKCFGASVSIDVQDWIIRFPTILNPIDAARLSKSFENFVHRQEEWKTA